MKWGKCSTFFGPICLPFSLWLNKVVSYILSIDLHKHKHFFYGFIFLRHTKCNDVHKHHQFPCLPRFTFAANQFEPCRWTLKLIYWKNACIKEEREKEKERYMYGFFQLVHWYQSLGYLEFILNHICNCLMICLGHETQVHLECVKCKWTNTETMKCLFLSNKHKQKRNNYLIIYMLVSTASTASHIAVFAPIFLCLFVFHCNSLQINGY